MKTLIELYDERPLENVLSTEVFRPERTVFICAGDVSRNKSAKNKLKEYFHSRGVDSELIFMETNLYDAKAILHRLEETVDTYPDCALDITGGTDDALFAAGMLCATRPVPVFTYSRKQNRFFNIHNAEETDRLACEVRYTVADCFRMAGGAMRMGRVDNSVLAGYLDIIDPLFRIFMNHRRNWNKIVTYIQKISQGEPDTPITLEASGPYTVKGEQGSRVWADKGALREMEAAGLISNLQIRGNDSVSFRFRDEQIRTWLRDVGSVLELYVYKACLDTEIYQDVRTSAVVDWDADAKSDRVTNEIDVMACRGVTPVFISCKVCDIKTEALNELAILRDRFGGQIAKAAIVTAETPRTITRNRAAELDIEVIDLENLKDGTLLSRLKALAK